MKSRGNQGAINERTYVLSPQEIILEPDLQHQSSCGKNADVDTKMEFTELSERIPSFGEKISDPYQFYCEPSSNGDEFFENFTEISDFEPSFGETVLNLYETNFESDSGDSDLQFHFTELCEYEPTIGETATSPYEMLVFGEDAECENSSAESNLDIDIHNPLYELDFEKGELRNLHCTALELPDVHVAPPKPATTYSQLWDVGVDKTPSARELLASVAPVMEKQVLPKAISHLAMLAIKKLPLIAIDKRAYILRGCIRVLIDQMDLYQELYSYVDKPATLDGLSDNGIKELYNKVRGAFQIAVNKEDAIPKPGLIACLDGVYDVFSECSREVRYNEYFFSCVRIYTNEIGKGSGKYFEEFIENMSGGASDVKQLFLEVLGVMLSGYMPKKFFLFLGERDTGKSMAANLLRLLLGDAQVFSMADPNEISGTWTLGSFPGKRLCYCPDSAQIPLTQASVAVMKQVTGSDLIKAHVKYQQPFTFINEAKLLLISNHPLCGAMDKALLSRLITVPFRHSVPAHKQIPDLAEKLYEERGYIVGKALRALKRLIANNFVFTKLREEVSGFSYGTLDSGNGIEEFVTDCCILDPESITSTAELFSAYSAYCERNGINALPNSAIFGRSISAGFPELRSSRSAGGAGVRGYAGIRLK